MNLRIAGLCMACLAQSASAFEVFPLGSGPSDNDQIIMWANDWNRAVAHDSDEPIDCSTPAARAASQCRFTYEVDPSIVPVGAEYLILRVKARSQIKTGKATGNENSALVYASFVGPDGAQLNHFIHTETYGDQANGTLLRRDVEYAQINAPIIDGEIAIQVGKRIIGKAEVELVVYLEGYLM